ncbi:MAG: histone deacetylase [Deltaproteobacteria bacterium]|nr:MAG: histone deacetylase [Deltaproteobacteria bacterium]
MKVFYTDHFHIPLPANHRFPLEKYSLLRQRIIEDGFGGAVKLCVPRPASDEEILYAHSSSYLQRLQDGEMTPKEMRRIGFPWSAELVERAKRSAGATIEACLRALDESFAMSLSGGTHHAFSDRGEGYCLLNDSVIAARTLQHKNFVNKILIIDCDVHQGNGTAAIVKNDASIFSFSIHGKNNFPYRKEKSDLDVDLEDGTDNLKYLEALEKGLIRALELSKAEFAIYLAGADPYADDRFGRLLLTKEGLLKRDRMVNHYCNKAGIPLAITMAGGYARKIKDTVDIHFETVKAAVECQRQAPKPG